MTPKKRKAAWPLCLSGTLTLVLFVLMALQSAPLSPAIPAIQLTFDEASFKAVLATWGAEGIKRFRTHFLIDFPFLVSYAVFGYRLARHCTPPGREGRPAYRLLAWTLPLAAALDACENLLHLAFIADGASPMAGAYLLAGLVSTGKWLLIAAFIVGFACMRRGPDRTA